MWRKLLQTKTIMKTIFDETTFNELAARLEKLTPEDKGKWGKMCPSQAMEHCARAIEMASGKKPMKQAFLGKMIGWVFRNSFLGEKPFPKNSPTAPNFIVKEEPDFDLTRTKLMSEMTEFHKLGETKTDGNIHGFFGSLTGKQWGETQYKHLDHHFRQFGR